MSYRFVQWLNHNSDVLPLTKQVWGLFGLDFCLSTAKNEYYISDIFDTVATQILQGDLQAKREAYQISNV